MPTEYKPTKAILSSSPAHLELSDEDDHHLPRVVVGIRGVHQRDHEPDGLQEGRETLPPVGADALPQRPQHPVEALNTVRVGRLGKGRQRQSRDGADLRVCVRLEYSRC